MGIRNDEEQKRIGLRIRDLRKTLSWVDESGIQRYGMTQEQLAAKAGLKRPYLSSIEKGKLNVGISTLVVIADVLGVSIELIKKD